MGSPAVRPRALALVTLSRLKRWVAASQTVVTVVAIVLLVALQIPGVSGVLVALGMEEDNFALNVLLPLVLLSVFGRLTELSSDINRGVPNRELFHGAMELYPKLWERVRLVRREENKKIQVIGMNLKTAWVSLNQKIPSGDFDGWTMEFCGLVDRQGKLSEQCNPRWSEEAHRQLQSVQRAQDSKSIHDREVVLRAYEYGHLPAVHGFCLANGDLFISILKWDDTGTFLRISNYTYEFVPREDETPAAAALRDIWAAWWRACSRHPFDASSAFPQ